MLVAQTKYDINGHTLILRNAKESDARALIEYLRLTTMETRYLIREPEEVTMTLRDEIEFIKRQNGSEYDVMLVGILDGELVGCCSITRMASMRQKHLASLALALYQKYTGMGIGRIMIEALTDIAKTWGVEQIELEVVADNEPAIKLYKKMGFEIFGTLPNNMKYKDGSYADSYWMMKRL